MHQPKESRYLPFTPAPRWTAEVKYELSHSGDMFDNAYVALNTECHLKQNHYYMLDQTETATPSYTLVNLSFGTDFKFRTKRLASVYLTVSNLFDRAYQSHLSRLKYTDINTRTGDMGICNMGRNVILKLVLSIL